MRIGYLECFAGISGDMMLGALVDAGVDFSVLEETAAALNVGARMTQRKVMRSGLTGTKVDVIEEGGTERAHAPDAPGPAPLGTGEDRHDHSHPHTHDHSHSHTHDHSQTHAAGAPGPSLLGTGERSHSHHHHRSLSAILAILQAAPLPERVKARSMRAFQLLGEAEAAIHSMPVEKVHFHEVGAVDTMIDIVCAAAGAEALGVDLWLASPLNVGSGTVVCAHGTLPVPAPATLALLGNAPIYSDGPPMERVTPTGAAVLRMLDVEHQALPPMRVTATGYGAGGRDTPGQPNLLRLLVGDAVAAAPQSAPQTEPIAVLQTVIDDCNPQVLSHACELLLAAGAWDAYRIPIQMKKGRIGVQLTVLCAPALLPAMREILFRQTTTIGLHWRIEEKIALAREWVDVETRWGKARVKVARLANGEQVNAMPEFEDCRALADAHGVPLKQVIDEAMRAWQQEPR